MDRWFHGNDSTILFFILIFLILFDGGCTTPFIGPVSPIGTCKDK